MTSTIGALKLRPKVELDLSGTNYGDPADFTDVTDDVMNASRISLNWGRRDRVSDITSGVCTFKLKNGDDGKYVPGLVSGPNYPNVRKRIRCRVSLEIDIPAGGLTFVDNGNKTYTMSGPIGFAYDRGNKSFLMRVGGFVDNGNKTLTYTGGTVTRTVYLFGGLVDSLKSSFDSGVFSVTVLSASDIFNRLGTDVPLRPMLHEEILVDDPDGFYPLGDQGPTLGDAMGAFPTMQAYAPSGAPDVAFQSASGSPDSAVTGVALGGFFSFISGAHASIGTPGIVELYFSTTFTGAAATLIGDVAAGVGIGIDASGNISDGAHVGPFIADGMIHQLRWHEADGSWYLDGEEVGTLAFTAIEYFGLNLVGTLLCIALYNHPGTYPTAQRFAEHLSIARYAGSGEATSDHAQRLLGYRTNFGFVGDLSRGKVGVHSTDAVDLQQALHDTSDAEGGAIFADGQCRIVLRGRNHQFDVATDLLLDSTSDHVNSTTEYSDDVATLVNKVTVTAPDGATQMYEDAASITQDGLAEQDVSLIVDSDASALAAAKWRVQTGVQEQTAADQVDINLYAITDAALALGVLQLQPLDVLTLQNMPLQTPTTEDFMVQGGTMTIGVDAFDVSLFTTPVPAGDPY